MTWSHRVMRDKNGNYGIVEAFYNAGGEVCLVTEPIEPFGETLEELLDNYRQMEQAFSAPLLKHDMEFAKPDWLGPYDSIEEMVEFAELDIDKFMEGENEDTV